MKYYSKLTLNGEERTVNFSVLAVGEIFKDLEVDVVGLGKLIATNNHLLLIPTILYRGIKAGIEEKGGLVDFTKAQVALWCMDKEDGVFNEEVQNVYIKFIESVYSYFPVLQKLQDEMTPSEDVKKN